MNFIFLYQFQFPFLQFNRKKKLMKKEINYKIYWNSTFCLFYLSYTFNDFWKDKNFNVALFYLFFSLDLHGLVILCVTKKMDLFHLFCQYFNFLLIFPTCLIYWTLWTNNIFLSWKCCPLWPSYFGRIKRADIEPFILLFVFIFLITYLQFHKFWFVGFFLAKKIFKG